MPGKLNRIENWEELARSHDFSAAKLASHCGVSLRHLERFYKREFNVSPHRWLREKRLRRAMQLLMADASVKQTAFDLGYKAPEHFSRDFKMRFGKAPSQLQTHP
jgi:transcriptional regulator GlxA family with amidase domain